MRQTMDTNDSYYSTNKHTIYQQEYDTNYTLNHIRNYEVNSSKLIIDYNRLNNDSYLHMIYVVSKYNKGS